MGLKDLIKKHRMIVEWESDAHGKRVIKPRWYLSIETDYKWHPTIDPEEVRAHSEDWLIELNKTIWSKLPPQSRFISGALAISAFLGEYLYINTNTDIAIPAQYSALEAHISAARQYHYYPMRRISGKISSKSPIIFHFFYPTTAEEVLGPKGKSLGRNFELTRINPATNMICTGPTPRNHIKFYLHSLQGGHILSTEDKKPIPYPPEYFRGVPIQVGDSNSRVYVIDPRYTYLKLKNVVDSREGNYQKHAPNLERLEDFLNANSDKFPIQIKD